jgi:hypothetical protein
MIAAPRFAVGVFVDWSQLASAATTVVRMPGPQSQISVLGQLASFSPSAWRTITGDHDPRVKKAIASKVELPFGLGSEALGCSDGLLAQRLRFRLDEGCTGLGEALSPWMMHKQAKRFEDDVRQGRLLLWTKLPDADQEQQVCEALLKARLLRLEVHDLVRV